MLARHPIAFILIGLFIIPEARADQGDAGKSPVEAPQVQLTAQQLFGVADEAIARGDTPVAEAAYRALANDFDAEIRSEAHFRLGMLMAVLGRHTEAAHVPSYLG